MTALRDGLGGLVKQRASRALECGQVKGGLVIIRALMRWKSVGRLSMVFLALAILSGCASYYVDSNVKEVDSSQFKKPNPLHPVQVLVEFQTKGVANERATTVVKSIVLAQVRASGLFSDVSEAPATDGALLSVTINNVPLSDDVFVKGFVTGFTFGLVGSTVGDGYVCSAQYVATTSSEPITVRARHAIYGAFGLTAVPPPNAIKSANVTDAVTLMTKQIVSVVLNDLSRDAAFK